jgi:hypothetical protein
MSFHTLSRVLSAVGVLAVTMTVSAYVIDCDDNDWVTGYATEHIDGDDAPAPKYDIFVNRSGYAGGYWYFYFRNMQYYPTGNAGDFAEIYINADRNPSTGGSIGGNQGFDYKLVWNLGDRTQEKVLANAQLWFWDAGAGEWEGTGNSYPVARGLATNTGPNGNEMFVEWSVPGSAIGNPSNLLWGAYLDDADTGPDDLCPDTMDQEAVPEPSTLLLVLAPVFGMFVRARRRYS